MNTLIVVPFAEGIEAGQMIVEIPDGMDVKTAHAMLYAAIEKVKADLPDEWEESDIERDLEARGFRFPGWIVADFVR